MSASTAQGPFFCDSPSGHSPHTQRHSRDDRNPMPGRPLWPHRRRSATGAQGFGGGQGPWAKARAGGLRQTGSPLGLFVSGTKFLTCRTEAFTAGGCSLHACAPRRRGREAAGGEDSSREEVVGGLAQDTEGAHGQGAKGEAEGKNSFAQA